MKTIWKQLLSNTILALGRCAMEFVKQLIARLSKKDEAEENKNADEENKE